MDEYENRLKNALDPATIAQVISKVVKNIITAVQGGENTVAELNFLKEKCICEDTVVNMVASNGMLWLVKNSILEAKSTLSDLVTTITTAKCFPNVSYLITKLIVLHLEEELEKNQTYKCPFNLRFPQHPLILILHENPNYWRNIFREIVQSYNTAVTDDCVVAYNEAFKPLFLYTIYDPNGEKLSEFKSKLWAFIIHNESPLMGPYGLIPILIPWLQVEPQNSVELNSELIVDLSELNLERNIFNPDLLILWQISSLLKLLEHNFDPRAIINSIRNVLEYHDDLEMLNPVLLILTKSIASSSTVYLGELLSLSKILVETHQCQLVTQKVLKAALLHWIANPTLITEGATKIAHEILGVMENNKRKPCKISKKHTTFQEAFNHLTNANREVHLALHLCVLQESWSTSEDLLDWLASLEYAPVEFLHGIQNFLAGLFLVGFTNPEIDEKIFEYILKSALSSKAFSAKTFTLISYKITQCCNPKLHLQMFRGLPQLVSGGNNAPKLLQNVVNIIQALDKGPGVLKTFGASLMFDLWQVEYKVYPFLENLLIAPYRRDSGDQWAFYITRASILKGICALRPELHGKDIVAHLSKILNECNNADGAVACALAIDGITILCKFEVIDIVTTWATLAPMLENDSRTVVIQSICNLIHEIPSLSYTEAYPKLTEEVIIKLWRYLVEIPDPEVWEVSLNAFTAFSLDDIVAHIPDEFLGEATANLRKAGSPISAVCWVEFMKNCDKKLLSVVGGFLIKLVRSEIVAYLKFVYHVKGTREPVDYSLLPINSVVRGIAAYIKSQIVKWKGGVYKEVYLECLRIFSQEYSKPLPPLDWCFLQELIHEPEAKDFCIDIASHQVILSGTARRLIVNYIDAVILNPNEADIMRILRNIKFLANSIQPFTLKPFLEMSIHKAVERFKRVQDSQQQNSYLEFAIEHLKTTLIDQNIQESNKVVIGDIISDVLEDCDIFSQLFHLLVDCITEAPLKCLENISCPKKTSKEKSPQWFQKAFKIRCTLAKKTSKVPLTCINDLLDIGSTYTFNEFIFQELSSVFQVHKSNTECSLWLLDLVGHIQAMVADKFEKKQLTFLCDIFVLAVVWFSGYFTFYKEPIDRMYKLFPRAVVTLFDINHWSICTNQALELFYHLNTEELVSTEYQEMFGYALRALRDEDEFKKNMKWMKYLNIECK